MTIKTECVIKHLKKDYKDLMTAVAAVSLVIIIAAVSISVWHYVYPSVLTLSDICTAYYVFIAITGITAAYVTIGLAVLGTPETFKYNVSHDDGTTIRETSSVWLFVGLALCMVWFVVFMYAFDGWVRNGDHPDVSIPALAISIYIIVVTPICGAIARCKE